MRSPDGSASAKAPKNKNDSQRNKGLLRKKGSADSDSKTASKSKKVKKKNNTAKKVLTQTGNGSKKVHLERVNIQALRAGGAGQDQEPQANSPKNRSPTPASTPAPTPIQQAGQVVENDDQYIQFVPNNFRKDANAAGALSGGSPLAPPCATPAATSPTPGAAIAGNDPAAANPNGAVLAPPPAPAPTPQALPADANHYENFLPLALRKKQQ